MSLKKYSISDSLSYTQLLEILNSYADENRESVMVITDLRNTKERYEKRMLEYEEVIKRLTSKIEEQRKEKTYILDSFTKKLTLKERILGRKSV